MQLGFFSWVAFPLFSSLIFASELEISNEFVKGPIIFEFQTYSHQIGFLSLPDNQHYFFYDEAEKVWFYSYDETNKNATLSSDFDLELLGSLSLQDESASFFSNTPQWRMIYFEDFQGQIRGWSNSMVSTCGTNSNVFLGGHCNFAGIDVSKDFTVHVNSKFNLHFIDDWNGEAAYARINNLLFWSKTYSWCDKLMPWHCKKYGIDTCGSDLPDKLAQFVQFEFTSSEETFTLTIGSSLTKGPCEASWGIDDLLVSVI